jgi:hypothetical protein
MGRRRTGRHRVGIYAISRWAKDLLGQYVSTRILEHILAHDLTEEFALIEASYGIVKIIQTFPNLRLPPGQPKEPTGQEKQNLTIVVSSAEGCKVLLN